VNFLQTYDADEKCRSNEVEKMKLAMKRIMKKSGLQKVF